MSPLARSARVMPRGFPRVSGDEPEFPFGVEYTQTFSPRERG